MDLELPEDLPGLAIPSMKANKMGWGPQATTLPDKFRDLPYQPFKKQDLLGKVSDWTGATYGESKRAKMYNSSMANAMGGQNQYAYVHEQDETTFQLVDNSKITRPVFRKRNYQQNNRFNNRGPHGQRIGPQHVTASLEGKPIMSKTKKKIDQERQRQQRKYAKQMQHRRHNNNNYNNKNTVREATIKIDSSYQLIETFDFISLSKLKTTKVSAGEDLKQCGSVRLYNKKYDTVSLRQKQKLMSWDNIYFQSFTITEDPVVRQINKEHTDLNVYTTDAILTTLMCCTRSINPWDILVYKMNGRLVFDLDSDRTSRQSSPIDLVTVSETSNECVPEDGAGGIAINKAYELAEEATRINQCFSQQVLMKGDEKTIHKADNAYPFQKEIPAGMVPPSKIYRYRKFELGDDIKMCVRTEVDATRNPVKNGKPDYMTIRCLNEWDSKYCNGVDWRKTLDRQASTVFMTELKNNSFKIARWIMGAILAGSSQLKLGYVTRDNTRDNRNHTIVCNKHNKPEDFAKIAGLETENAWGILRCLVDKLRGSPDGKYYIIKNPNSKDISIYKYLSEDSSDEESDEEGSSEEDEDDSDDEEGNAEE